MGKSGAHRRKHRQQSHHQSHADATINPVLEGNPLVPTDEADWIDTKEEFLALCDELEESCIFSYDTEFIGEDSGNDFDIFNDENNFDSIDDIDLDNY